MIQTLQPTKADWTIPFPGVDKETYLEWCRYSKARPHIFRRFQEETFNRIRAGAQRVGAKDIAESIRWDTDEHGNKKKNDEYLINNNYVSYYARAFQRRWPRYASIFEIRETRGLKGN